MISNSRCLSVNPLTPFLFITIYLKLGCILISLCIGKILRTNFDFTSKSLKIYLGIQLFRLGKHHLTIVGTGIFFCRSNMGSKKIDAINKQISFFTLDNIPWDKRSVLKNVLEVWMIV